MGRFWRVSALMLFVAAGGAAGFTFTVTADPRSNVATWDAVLAGINTKVGGPGAFHVSPGDIDPPQPLRQVIDTRFGPGALWYPGVGNHEIETVEDMLWIRAEYDTGNSVRTPLKYSTNQDGPAGCVQTTYSWDHENAHFITLNEYWNGATAPGSDVATDGDIVPQLYDWLAADLAANTKPVVFVFGHEPAFPFHRHVGDSLDKYPAHRDAFWSLLETEAVQAYICGHTHVYSRYQPTLNSTWQIDVGNAGNDTDADGQTFANIEVTPTQVKYEVWRNAGGLFALAETWTEPIGLRMRLNPTLVERAVYRGEGLPNDTFAITPIGPGPLTYTIDDDADWLRVSPTGGTSTGETDQIDIIYSDTRSVVDLPVGQYTATITVTSDDADNSPQRVTVKLSVQTVRPDFDGDGDVDMADFGHLQACLTESGAPPLGPNCLDASVNGDGYVNSTDMAILLRCLSGANIPAERTCDD